MILRLVRATEHDPAFQRKGAKETITPEKGDPEWSVLGQGAPFKAEKAAFACIFGMFYLKIQIRQELNPILKICQKENWIEIPHQQQIKLEAFLSDRNAGYAFA